MAYRFHNLTINLFDLHQRPTYDAFIRAFELKGFKRPNATKVLPNIVFHEKDMMNSISLIPNSIVVCLHGCNEVNSNAIELASKYNSSGWIVMPCCIKKDQYLGESCQVLCDDDQTRFTLLIGALSSQYNAQEIRTIDKRITNRNILIAGGVISSSLKSNNNDYITAYKRNRMPKLILS